MAIYRLSSQVIGRSRGQSVIACAAYRAGDQLYDERTGEAYDFTKKQDAVFEEIILPEGAPGWMSDRQTLWNFVEATEKRKDSQLAREVQLALPRELTLSQNIALTREFVKDQYVSMGMVADIGIHDPKASDGAQQPHAHVLLTMREIKGDGFGLKAREWNERCELRHWREAWMEYANKHLAMHGHDMRIDHRTLAEQGIDLEPQKKVGTASNKMAAYRDHMATAERNGEKLLQNPEIVLDALINQQSTFTHQDIARVVNRYTATPEQFQVVYEKVKALPELVYLDTDDRQIDRFTTKDMLQLETEMVGNAQALAVRDHHGIGEVSVTALANKHQLSEEQGRVLDHLIKSHDIATVVGYAGTGKSRMLGAAREGWEQLGYRVIGASLSGIAAENLEASSGIESRTLASHFYRWDRGQSQLSANDILVIDEAGMLGSQQLGRAIDEAAKQGAKVVLIGDPEQLQAIQAGAAFRAISEHVQPMELVEIWRQREAWQKEATVQFATGQTSNAIAQYAEHDSVHQFDTQSQAKDAMIGAWNNQRISQPDKTQIMLAYTKVDVADLNEMARSERLSSGELGDSHVIQTAKGEREFAENERIYFLKNNRGLGVKNGTLGTILGISDGLTGKELLVQLDKNDHGQPMTVNVSTRDYNHLDYGYAATIHKSQGVTVDRTYLLSSQYLDRHATYVAMTRHRESAEVYWSKEVFPSQDAMINTLGRERLKDVTLDYLSDDYAKASFAAHRGIDTLWDHFWEKHGKAWLEKIQDTLYKLADGVKELIDTMKDHVASEMTLNTAQADKDIDRLDGEDWLNEMRALRDEAYRKNPELERELRRCRADTTIDQAVEKNSVLSQQGSYENMSEEKKANYEERYQAIMRETRFNEYKDRISKVEKRTDLSKQVDKEIDL